MNGKGDSPRNCFSKQFKDRYEDINWREKNKTLKKKKNLIIKQGKDYPVDRKNK